MSVDDDFDAFFAANRWLGKQVEIITPHQLSSEEVDTVPARWRDIVATPGRPAIDKTLEMWRNAIGNRLPLFLEIIDRFGYSIHLARVTAQIQSTPVPQFLLLYVFHNTDAFRDGFDMRIGFPPRALSDLPAFWGQLPENVRSLYHHVHDGFLTNLWAAPAGLMQSCDMRALGDSFGKGLLHHGVRGPSDLEYSVCDEHGEPLCESTGLAVEPGPWPDLSSLIAVCRNRGTARLLINISANEQHAWELWDHNLERWPNLWGRLDDWLVQAFITDGYRPPSK